MDGRQFDELTRVLVTLPSRREVLRLLAAGAAGSLLAAFGRTSAAAKDKEKDKDKDKPSDGTCKDDRDCPADQYCFNPEVGCVPKCPLPCHAYDPGTGSCVDACPEDQFCDRLGGAGDEVGGCSPKCPQPCAPYDFETKACEDSCGSCLVCKQGICQNGCSGACEICDQATGQCRGCDGPCEYCDGGDCVGCDATCETCVEGTCRTTCQGGQTCCLGQCLPCCGLCDRTIGLCSGEPCGQPQEELGCCHGMCTNLTYDQANCGTCGNICSGVDGETCCNGQCVNTGSDPDNCGGCGQECLSADAQCCQGTCYAASALQTDSANCGTCGTACGEGEACCQSSCVDTTTDSSNCGACGNACGAGEICTDGSCEFICEPITCPEGQTLNPETCGCECSGFQTGCASNEICQDGQCEQQCLDTSGGGVHNGTFVACSDENGNFIGCFCNRCGTTCNHSGGYACCSDGCQYVVTTCEDMGH